MVAYTVFTITTTAWRTKFRRQANAADNKGATVAVDSLINYEAVKVGPSFRFLPKQSQLSPRGLNYSRGEVIESDCGKLVHSPRGLAIACALLSTVIRALLL